MADIPPAPMKYIVFETPRGEAPVLFPHEFTHSWVAGQMRPMKAVSAGFVEPAAGGGLRCYGNSSSLQLISRGEEDTALVRRHLAGEQPE